MPTYLLTWNPSKWEWTSLAEEAAQTGNGSTFERYWACGNTKSIRRDDRIFLLRQAVEPRGIVASGLVTSEAPYLDRHWDDVLAAQGEQRLYVNVSFDRIIDATEEQPLPLSSLLTGRLAQVPWSTQKGGIRIDDDAAAELEGAWQSHLNELDRPDGDRLSQRIWRNPTWQRDELILALDLYFRHPPRTVSQDHPEVIALSNLLNALPIHSRRADGVTFRNPNGVYMKLGNFLRFDPTYEGRGLERGGRLEERIWAEFSDNRQLLAVTAEAIRQGHNDLEATMALQGDPEEEEFPEGRILYRLHRSRERNRLLVHRAKSHAMQMHGRLTCAACGFDFALAYGSLGDGFIECHHTRPVSEMVGNTPTRLSDIALICANCHRMVHRRRPWLELADLRSLLAQPSG